MSTLYADHHIDNHPIGGINSILPIARVGELFTQLLKSREKGTPLKIDEVKKRTAKLLEYKKNNS